MNGVSGMTRLTKKPTYKGELMIATGAIIWGTQGPFAQNLMQLGCHPLMVSVIKLFTGCTALMLILACTAPKQLRISPKVLLATFVVGLVSQAGFNSLYYTSVGLIGIANAAVLLYTSPVFFLILSLWIFKEKLTWIKAGSAVLCVLGCGIAVTGGSLNLAMLSLSGIGMALLSAITFAIMSAIGKKVLTDCEPIAFIAYSFLFGGLLLLPALLLSEAHQVTFSMGIIWNGLGIGLLPAAFSYWLYFGGVKLQVPLSKAGVISSLEMVSAVLIAWIVFKEPTSWFKGFGIVMILCSIVMTNIQEKRSVEVCSTEADPVIELP